MPTLVPRVLCRAAVGGGAALLAIALATSSMPVQAQRAGDSTLAQALGAATPRLVRSHVQFLSHDLLAGRDTGAAGYEIAREYVASQFQRMGLQAPYDGSYLQEVPLLEAGPDAGSAVAVGDLSFTAPDVSVQPDWSGRAPEWRGEGVFAGYGLVTDGRDDFRGLDLANRVVFMLAGVPEAWAEDPVRSLLGRLKIGHALERGAAGVVILQPEGNAPSGRIIALADGTAAAPRAWATIGGAATQRLLQAWGVSAADLPTLGATGRAPRVVGPVVVTRHRPVQRLSSWNVVGIVPGSDPARRHESVVFTAHLDHVGVAAADDTGDRIFNGTHDNALGVGKLLASAEILARLRPARTVVFVAVGAEERGLLGTWHYVRQPVGRTADIVANINHDGGLDSGPPDDVFAFGAEFSDLARHLGEVATEAGMRMRLDFQAPFTVSQGLLFRSDQYAFLALGIPGIYLMDGFTIGGDPELGRRQWDHYLAQVNHRQRDNFNPAWTFEAPVRMAQLSVRLAMRLADMADRPRMNPGSPFPTPIGREVLGVR